jgi:hypothetical protein
MKPQTLIANTYLPLLLVLSVGSVIAGEQATDQQAVLPDASDPAHTHSDDWNVVSAPPPLGPYNTINLDPRLPGQKQVEPMPIPEVPVSRAMASTPEGPGRASAMASMPTQSSIPPQTPYDYQSQLYSRDQLARAQDRRDHPLTPPGQPGREILQRPDTRVYGPAGITNAPYPSAGMPANRPQPPVASVQQRRHEQRPPQGYYRSQDYSHPATRPMYGYPWPSRRPSSGYPAAGYSHSPWQVGDPRASEVEVPSPSVYNRMMAEPPPTRYAPPPGMTPYYGGGR